MNASEWIGISVIPSGWVIQFYDQLNLSIYLSI